MAQVPAEELHHLPAHLQIRHIGVQVDSIQTVEVEDDVPFERVVDVHRAGHVAVLTRARPIPEWRQSLRRPRLVELGGPRLPSLVALLGIVGYSSVVTSDASSAGGANSSVASLGW